MKKFLAKRKLKHCFNVAGLYFQSNWNGKTLKSFPSIVDVRIRDTKTTYVFKLPHGLDPREVKKKEFVFRSMFGPNIEIKSTKQSNFILSVYLIESVTTYRYNFEELRPTMSKYKLPIIAGVDANGQLKCYNMTENPHLLIAGETGSGKSVMLRAILTSLIQHKRTGLRLHLADLKRSEFSLFRHVDIVESVMTSKKDVARCVDWFHKEMTKRGDLLDNHELAHVDDLPEAVDYLVLCIDEFSILRDQKDTMEKLTDIAALGRALGIYLILSTQRPDRKVIDGLMKANLTVRYAFRHTDKINSRITLGEGAEVDASKIDESERGKFYMRYSGCHMLQSPLLEVEEAKAILESFKVPFVREEPNGDVIIDMEEDPYYDEEEEEYFAPLELGGDTHEQP